MIVSLGALFFTAAYLILIELFYKGWVKLPDFVSNKKLDTAKMVSVVICCKNEADNLPALVNSLKLQTVNDFELVLVDDNSEDNTYALMQSLTAGMSSVKLLKSTGIGKKQGLIQGIEAAGGELIFSTDADCKMSSLWVETLLAYHTEHAPDLLLGPVVFASDGSLFGDIQKLEFASLVTSTAGAVGAGLPILANASNLSFPRRVFLESKKDLRVDIPSGDDIFLLHSVKSRKGKIDFLKSQDVMVETKACPDLKTFVKQRKRWASKSSALRDYQQIFIILMILGISFMEILALLAGLFRHYYWVYFVMIFVAKFIADYVIMSKVRKFFSIKKVFIHSLILSVFYPFYTLFITISSFNLSYYKRKDLSE